MSKTAPKHASELRLRFANMRIGARLGLMTLICATTMPAPGDLLIHGMDSLSEDTAKLYRQRYAVGASLREIQTEVTAMQRDMKDTAKDVGSTEPAGLSVREALLWHSSQTQFLAPQS